MLEDNLQVIWNKVPLNLRDRLDMGRKVNGDYSVHKGGYRPLRKIGKFVKNHIPMELRDEFIQEFVTKDLDYFNSKYKEGRRGKSNNRDWFGPI
tara:strand:- start:1808 stop:2089 length:282 start_codon:yes stop_codon:yes gene_type:complete